jgi:hypothetical protein
MRKFSRSTLGQVIIGSLALSIFIGYGSDFFGVKTTVDSLLSSIGGGHIALTGAALANVAIFPTTPEQMAIAVGYRNKSFIADQVLPRIPVGKQEFKYNVYDKRDSFTLPDTKVSRKGEVNFVEFPASFATGSCDAYALADFVPQEDLDNAAGTNYNPRTRSGEELRHMVALAREKRTADLLFAAANYTLKTQLAGNHQWNVFAQADADPVEDIMAGMDACLIRPNMMVIGQLAYTKLRTNPNILKAVNRTSGDKGVATRQDLIDLFELADGLYVGESYLNTAKKGQNASMSRVWGKHCLLAYIDRAVQSVQGRITYGFTAQWGDPFGGELPDATSGAKGGYRIQQGEYVAEKLIADNCAYFIQDCVA